MFAHVFILCCFLFTVSTSSNLLPHSDPLPPFCRRTLTQPVITYVTYMSVLSECPPWPRDTPKSLWAQCFAGSL